MHLLRIFYNLEAFDHSFWIKFYVNSSISASKSDRISIPF